MRHIWRLRIGDLAYALDGLPLNYEEEYKAEGLVNQLWGIIIDKWEQTKKEQNIKDISMWPWLEQKERANK